MKFITKIRIAYDYIFYRVAKVHIKKDGKSGITSIYIISLFSSILLISTAILTTSFFYGKSFLADYRNMIKQASIPIALIILYLNYIYFKNKYEILDKKYKNEKEPTKSIRGVLVVVILFLLPILISIFLIKYIHH